MSPAQQRFYVLNAMAPDSVAYNVPLVVGLRGAIDVPKLERALSTLTARHAVLRTHFRLEDGVLLQHVDAVAPASLEVRDVAEADVPDLLAGFIRPFDLGRPLMRALLLRTGADLATFMLDVHHIVLDGFSTGILLRELLWLYAGESLPPPKLQYADYVAWLERPAQRARRERQAAWWQDRFKGELPVLNLPTDLPRPPVRSLRGGSVGFTLPPPVVDAWRRLAREEGASLFMVCLAAFHVFLGKLSGQDHTVVGTPIAGRNHPDLEEVVGVLVNTLALGNRVNSCQSFRAFLAAVRASTLEAFEHQEHPFEELVEQLGAHRDSSRNPVYDAFIALQNMEVSAPPGAQLELLPQEARWPISKFDLSLFLKEQDGGLSATFEYASDLFHRDTAERFARRFEALARGIAADPERPVAELSLLDAEERAQLESQSAPLLHLRPAPTTVTALFDAAVARFGDRPALVSATGETLTYAAFDEQVARLAGALAEKGVGRGSVVALRLDRSVEFVVAAYAVMRLTATVLPIGPKTPPERTAFLVRDSGAKLVLAREAGPPIAGAGQLDVRALLLSAHAPAKAAPAYPEEVAYLIYTSGSTGTPKAVMLEHRTLVNELLALQRAYPLGPDGVYLQKSAITFDMSVAELFGWFHAGGRLALLEPDGERDPLIILRAVERSRVTHLNFVPSVFGAWVESLHARSARQLESLRYVFLGGESVAPGPVHAFGALCPWVEVHNVYGPSEATYVSGFPLREWDGATEIAIGKPFAGVCVRIIDHHGNLAPIGVIGELLIGGGGVSRGYLNRPEWTAERFVPDPFHGAEGGRLYRSGDAARWRPDGNLEFRGRMDHQVKVRGFRVELGEVEAAMRRCPGVQDAVATVQLAAGKEPALCGYFVAEDGYDGPPLEEALRTSLANALTDYMVPTYLVQLPALPLNASGKADRKALPVPSAAPAVRAAAAAPDDEVERAVAAAWARVLGTGEVSSDDNFFDLGGTSLGLIRLQSLLREALPCEVSVATLFRFPTVRSQAAHLKSLEANRQAAPTEAPADRSRLVARRRRVGK